MASFMSHHSSLHLYDACLGQNKIIEKNLFKNFLHFFETKIVSVVCRTWAGVTKLPRHNGRKLGVQLIPSQYVKICVEKNYLNIAIVQILLKFWSVSMYIWPIPQYLKRHCKIVKKEDWNGPLIVMKVHFFQHSLSMNTQLLLLLMLLIVVIISWHPVSNRKRK